MSVASSSNVATIDVESVLSNDFYDVETNEVIPQAQIGVITNRLLEAGRLIDNSGKAWNRAIRSNGGDKAAATAESKKILPGGLKTQLFDQLSEDKCLVNMRIVGPPLILTDMDDKEKSSEYKNSKCLCMMQYSGWPLDLKD